MAVKRFYQGGRVGYRWGTEGKLYFYTPGNREERDLAKRKAESQGRSIESNQRRGKK